jgi:hypothetical protein
MSLNFENISLLSEKTFLLTHQHLIKLGIWAIFSIVSSLVILWKGYKNHFWQNFGLQFLVWGLIDGIIVAIGLRDTTRLDITGIIGLREFLWLNEGLDIGYVAVGITLFLVGKHANYSAKLVGAGSSVFIQGAVLLLLDSILIWQLPNKTLLLGN